MDTKKTIGAIVGASVIGYLALSGGKNEEVSKVTKESLKTTFEKKQGSIYTNDTIKLDEKGQIIKLLKKQDSNKFSFQYDEQYIDSDELDLNYETNETNHNILDYENNNDVNETKEIECSRLSKNYKIAITSLAINTNNYLLLLDKDVLNLSDDETYKEINKDFFTFISGGVINFVLDKMGENIPEQLKDFKSKKTFNVEDYMFFFDNLHGTYRYIAMDLFIHNLLGLKDNTLPFVDYLYDNNYISKSFYDKIKPELEKRIYDDSSNDCETTYNILGDGAVAKCYENENYISDGEQNLDDLKEQIEELGCK